MKVQYQNNKEGGFFSLTDQYQSEAPFINQTPNLIHIIWNRSSVPMEFWVDHMPIQLLPQQITTATFLQKLEFNPETNLTAYSFNREFYCISDHDQEVSCNGIIFFGTQDIPIITLDKTEARKF